MFEVSSQIGEPVQKYKILFFLVVLILVAVTYYEIVNYNKSSTEIEVVSNPQPSEIIVDVSGAVNKPGVYKLFSEARVSDALALAQGISTHANSTWVTSNINLSKKLVDSQKVYIPFEWESEDEINFLALSIEDPKTTVLEEKKTSSEEVASSLLSINSASLDELMDLPGIGEVYAERIIENRPYTDLKDLVENGIVGESLLKKISPYVSI